MQTQEDRYSGDSEAADSLLVQQALNGDQDAFESLVSRALCGDQDAFEALVNRYRKPLFGLIYHYVDEYHETEDILQQVWLQLYLSLASLRPLVQIKPWLSAVARNRSLDFLRHKHVRFRRLLLFSELESKIEEDEGTILDTLLDSSPTPEEQVEHRDLQGEIQLAIQSLPHPYRPVVWLFYRDQLTYAEIGRILDKSGSAVKTRFNRAKPLLRAACMAQ